MGDNQVTIDPEFDPHRDRGRGRNDARLAIPALVLAAGLFGWLLGTPVAPDSDGPETAASTSTAPDTVAAASTSTPPDTVTAASTSTPPDTVTAPTTATRVVTETVPVPGYSPLAVLHLPLSDAVPGFTDRIVMLATPSESYTVTRWEPSEAATEVALSLERDVFSEDGGWSVGAWPVGFDASGGWFAQVQSDGVLAVSPVSENQSDPVESEAVGTHVSSVAWHDTEPGRLAWISCTGSQSGPATLHTLEVWDPTAQPVPGRVIDQGCLGWGDGVWLERWSGEDALIESEAWDGSDRVFVDAEGAKVAIESDSPPLDETSDRRLPGAVPGLADGESVWEIAWSPDRTLVALVLDRSWDTETPTFWGTETSGLRVVDSETGGILAEVSEQDSAVFTMAWSTDSRFLLYEPWNFNTESGALVFYDTVTNTTIRITLSEIIDEIRTANPS